MKLAMRPKHRPMGATDGADVDEGQDGKPAPAGEQTSGDRAADQAAMEGHAAAPDLQDLERVLR